MINRIVLALVVLFAGLALGTGLGLYVGWEVWPVSYVNTGVNTLRPDYQNEYVVMVATSYGWEGDLDRARLRLQRLAAPGALDAVEATIAHLNAAGDPAGDPAAAADLQRLNRLAVDLRAAGDVRAATPSPTPSASATRTPALP